MNESSHCKWMEVSGYLLNIMPFRLRATYGVKCLGGFCDTLWRKVVSPHGNTKSKINNLWRPPQGTQTEGKITKWIPDVPCNPHKHTSWAIPRQPTYLGSRWKKYDTELTTTVWPALFPPCKKKNERSSGQNQTRCFCCPLDSPALDRLGPRPWLEDPPAYLSLRLPIARLKQLWLSCSPSVRPTRMVEWPRTVQLKGGKRLIGSSILPHLFPPM